MVYGKIWYRNNMNFYFVTIQVSKFHPPFYPNVILSPSMARWLCITCLFYWHKCYLTLIVILHVLTTIFSLYVLDSWIYAGNTWKHRWNTLRYEDNWWRRRVKETIYIWIPYKFYKWEKASRNGVRNMYTITINDK